MDSIGRFEMLDFKNDVAHWRKKDELTGAIQQSAFDQEFGLDHDGFGEPLDACQYSSPHIFFLSFVNMVVRDLPTKCGPYLV